MLNTAFRVVNNCENDVFTSKKNILISVKYIDKREMCIGINLNTYLTLYAYYSLSSEKNS